MLRRELHYGLGLKGVYNRKLVRALRTDFFFLTTLRSRHCICKKKTQILSRWLLQPLAHTQSALTGSGLVPVAVLEDSFVVLISLL